MMDIRDHNRRAWDREVARGNPWTIPVTPAQIADARHGEWQIVLTPTKPVPRSWFPPLAGCRVLGLASGGGQQGPLLAAAGARVTVLDNSPAQLSRDREVAEREGLDLTTCEGDMRDLSVFADASFDFIVHPISNVFVPKIEAVWREAFRVLAPGGSLIAGLVNPIVFCFDLALQKQSVLTARYPLPYSDLASLTPRERAEYFGVDEPVEWSHSLEEQIGGQLDAGFVLTGFYEDVFGDNRPESELFNRFAPFFFATRAVKPER